MKILIETINNKLYTIKDIEKDNTIADLRREIYIMTDLIPARQRLIFGGNIIKNDKLSISDCQIKDGSKIFLLLDV